MDFPTPVLMERAYTLTRNVSAIQILPSDSPDQTRLGLITQLPEGMEIEIEGPGFSDRTVWVRCSGASYFVFLEDLESVKKQVAMAAHAWFGGLNPPALVEKANRSLFIYSFFQQLTNGKALAL